MDFLFTLDGLASLFTLTILEIVLGIDNLLFLSVITNKLPTHQQNIARKLGLIVAMFSRLLLLATINWITQFESSLFTILTMPISIRSMILMIGGIFLVFKAVGEIHEDIEGCGSANLAGKQNYSHTKFWSVILQVMILDIVFSLDSVMTAVGMTHDFTIMSIAIIISVIIMLFSANPISNFINNHPTVKMLALSFLILVGVMLMGESMGHKIEKGYLYFAIAFSMSVECLNIFAAKKKKNKSIKNGV